MIENLYLKSCLEKYCDEWVNELLPEISDHKFSLRYKIKKRRILKMRPRFKQQFTRTPIRKALYYAVLSVILAALFTGTAIAAYTIFMYFKVDNHDKYSSVFSIRDDDAPGEILKKYEITYDFTEYDKEIMNDDALTYWIIWSKGDMQIQFVQYPKCYYKNIRYNTELSPTGIVQEEINGNEAIYFETRDGSHCYTINTDDYIIDISCNIDKNSAHNVAKSVK